MEKKVLKLKKREFGLQLVVNIILGILVVTLLIILISQNVNSNKETVKFNNPYDIQISDTDNFVLLGDSITEGYPVDEFYDDLPVIKSGVSGYKTQDILNNLEKMVSVYNPTKVFILIGTNDIQEEDKSEEVLSNIEKIVEGIHTLRPKAKIYLESIYPVNDSDSESVDKDMVANRSNDVIRKINKSLKKYCQEHDLVYIDVYKELADKDGNLDLKYTNDGLHMSNLGYLRVTKTLLPYFQD